jgi:type I site-specific restriction endonuclease
MSLRARIKKLERRPRQARLDPEALADVVRFNEVAGSRLLRPYQAEVARAVVESIAAGRGDVLTVMMARQMGKNQLSAALEHYLLHRFADAGGQIVKCTAELSLGYRR